MEDQNLTPTTQVPAEQRSLGMWMHLTPLLATFASFIFPIPFLSLIATFIIYSTQKDKGTFVLENGKESVNFQISLAIVFVALMIILVVVFGGSILSTVMGGQYDNDAGHRGGHRRNGGVEHFPGFGFRSRWDWRHCADDHRHHPGQ